MPQPWMKSLVERIASLLGKKTAVDTAPPVEEEELCCQGKVHIAYRGISDDRMYMARDRKWSEVKFFRPNSLRVFCVDCRRRLL